MNASSDTAHYKSGVLKFGTLPGFKVGETQTTIATTRWPLWKRILIFWRSGYMRHAKTQTITKVSGDDNTITLEPSFKDAKVESRCWTRAEVKKFRRKK